jgi:basic membrane protein A
MYVLGRLAALTTKTGKIGFVGGLELPFLRGDINIIKQALKDSGLNVKFEYVFVGDFNDPVKAKQATEGLISRGNDVIIPVVNLGIYGVFSAVQEAKSNVYVTSLYTDKKQLAPNNFLTSDLFNFTPVLEGVVSQIIAGTKGGYIEMGFGEGKSRYTEFPINNVSEDVNNKVKTIAEDVAAGKIQLQIDLNEILP